MFDQHFNWIPNPPTVRVRCTKTVQDVLAADIEFAETELDQRALEQFSRRYRDLDRAARNLILDALFDEADPNYQFVDGESLWSRWELATDQMPLAVTAAAASSKAAALVANGFGGNLVAVPEGTPGAEADGASGEYLIAAVDLLRHLLAGYETPTSRP